MDKAIWEEVTFLFSERYHFISARNNVATEVLAGFVVSKEREREEKSCWTEWTIVFG